MSGQTGQSAVLLLAHGTPDVLGEMAEYLDKVTGGRTIPESVVKELQHRYAQIGLGDTPGAEPPPLTRWTLIQANLLERALDRAGDSNARVYAGMRNWHPYIADTIAQMRLDGVTHIKVICLAPQNSRTSVGLYRKAVLAAADGLEVDFVTDWAEHPLLAQAFAQRLWPVWALACAQSGRRVPVLFTAHSVPCRTIMTSQGAATAETSPDPYAVEAKRTATLVARRMAPVGFGDKDWYFAFQSQGISGGPWIGPTVEDTLKAIRAEGHVGVVMQPVGFLCDHVEILYDIDIAFAEKARELGLELWRAQSLNDSDLLISALAEVASGQYQAEVEEAAVLAQV
ncbi:MAG: ferrochelatase [Acidobacteriales bacterium 59-55]|nr:ferrochelatase [Terriglobales bacterium]OJV42432.1 MAG: ferrochelatase [Acidobacteriales bacterium 59-55]